MNIAHLEKFTGDKDKFWGFLRSLKLNIMERSDSLNTNERKMCYALSFMQTREAGDWAEDFVEWAED